MGADRRVAPRARTRWIVRGAPRSNLLAARAQTWQLSPRQGSLASVDAGVISVMQRAVLEIVHDNVVRSDQSYMQDQTPQYHGVAHSTRITVHSIGIHSAIALWNHVTRVWIDALRWARRGARVLCTLQGQESTNQGSAPSRSRNYTLYKIRVTVA